MTPTLRDQLRWHWLTLTNLSSPTKLGSVGVEKKKEQRKKEEEWKKLQEKKGTEEDNEEKKENEKQEEEMTMEELIKFVIASEQ